MAPHLQPPSLRRAAMTATSVALDDACTRIFLEQGPYGISGDCAVALAHLQDFLISTLPLSLFEQLAEERNVTKSNTPSWSWYGDQRIKLSLFMHPSLTHFGVDSKGNELMQPIANEDNGLDEWFWRAHLGRMNNLVELGLNLIATDGILMTVGASCPRLRVINVVSRIRQSVVLSVSGSLGGHHGVMLKYCVSDIGLHALLQCQDLRKVIMNKVTNLGSPSASPSITLAGVRSLVDGLPKLEHIHFGSVGKVLAAEEFGTDRFLRGNRQPLALTYFSESDPRYVDVRQLEVACPRLTELSLAVPMHYVNGVGFISKDVDLSNLILKSLAESELPLRTLELQHFEFGEDFERLLASKGCNLDSLTFRCNGALNSSHLDLIGQHCPKLRRLHVKEMGAEPKGQPPPDAATLRRKGFFATLAHLNVSGRHWDPNVVLPLLLAAAENITSVSLLNTSCRRSIDLGFDRVVKLNSLRRLAALNLYGGCLMSLPALRALALDICPRLTHLTFPQAPGMRLTDVEALRAEITSLNLDLTLCCLELYDPDEGVVAVVPEVQDVQP